MMKVDRDRVAFPPSLASRQAMAARHTVELVLRLGPGARSQRRLQFDARVFAHDDVHASLQELFEGRCAFCERGPASEDLMVEHFRPLRSAFNASGEPSDDHYAWFAYEWRNLYLACAACNRFKKAAFPVRGARAPVFSSLDEARAFEDAFLIDPCFDEPSRHLAFQWSGACEPISERGKATIAIFCLNRDGLLEDRRKLAVGLLDLLGRAGDLPPSGLMERQLCLLQTRSRLGRKSGQQGEVVREL